MLKFGSIYFRFWPLAADMQRNYDWIRIKSKISVDNLIKHFMLVNYDCRAVIWGIFQAGTTLES